MSVPPRGATRNCPLWRAEPNKDTRLQATGPCDRPAYEDPCHITWVCQLNCFEGADEHSQSPETRWSCRKSRDIERGFKAVLCGSPRTSSGVGVIVSERFRDSIVSVERFDDGLTKIVVAGKERLYHFFSAYAPQSGCFDQAKDEFWSLLDEKTAEVPSKDVIIVAGDLNGHVGATKDGTSCHGGFGCGTRNADVNTVFRKRDSHLVSYYSGSTKTQIDIVLVRDRDRSLVTDAKDSIDRSSVL
ncbi:unnamed protein product [Heligmosomoides polygyrus]|uniref:Endo/exonuclease/phosphatase domain-containing protein n=1 Tax=Heligmosomoides polygyrus TaxID=6339 RepID=A0A183FRF2_HELPZ|nr:unnamed protein product [Heligmosomoides polygyrus]